jgi:SAM-dependent methyltransferase
MTQASTVEYIMEDPREAARLERKLDPQAFMNQYLGLYLFQGARVLSVGCGPAVTLREICKKYSGIYTTGIDISPERLQQARERNSGNPRVQLVCGDAQDMQFETGSFDLVYSRMLLQYLTRKEQAVREMVRVCKPGGIVVLQDLDGQLVWHYPEDPAIDVPTQKVLGALAESGFDPFVGRKLFSLAQKAGLKNIDVKVECYHLIAGEVSTEVFEQWETKLEIARPTIIRALGSETEAAGLIRRFLAYIQRPDTITYSNVFTITGEKPL